MSVFELERHPDREEWERLAWVWQQAETRAAEMAQKIDQARARQQAAQDARAGKRRSAHGDFDEVD